MCNKAALEACLSEKACDIMQAAAAVIRVEIANREAEGSQSPTDHTGDKQGGGITSMVLSAAGAIGSMLTRTSNDESATKKQKTDGTA